MVQTQRRWVCVHLSYGEPSPGPVTSATCFPPPLGGMEDLTEDERRDIIEDDLRAEADALDDDTFARSDGLCSTSGQRLFKNLAVAAEESLDSSTFKSYK